jgi:hypothetical protein
MCRPVLVYPAVLSLWLGRAHGAAAAGGDLYALPPVLIGFALTLAALPVFALVWGARVRTHGILDPLPRRVPTGRDPHLAHRFPDLRRGLRHRLWR